MDSSLFEAVKNWVKEMPNREATITLGGPVSPTYYSINVYDYNLRIGQDVKKIEEIDLLGKKKRQIEALRNKIEKLESEVEEYGRGGGLSEHLSKAD